MVPGTPTVDILIVVVAAVAVLFIVLFFVVLFLHIVEKRRSARDLERAKSEWKTNQDEWRANQLEIARAEQRELAQTIAKQQLELWKSQELETVRANQLEIARAEQRELAQTVARQQLELWRNQELEAAKIQLIEVARREAQVELDQWKATHSKDIRQDAIQKSQAVVTGKVTEHFVPYLPDFHFNPKDARFLGTPIDFVVFDGLDEGDVKRVVFIEVKTGASTLSVRERQVRKAIEARDVEWVLVRPQLNQTVSKVVETLNIEYAVEELSQNHSAGSVPFLTGM